MLYYCLKINSFPIPTHAFSITTRNFNYTISDDRGNIFELTYVHHGEFEKMVGKKIYNVKSDDVSFDIPGQSSSNKSVTDNELNFMSVGVNIDNFECEIYKWNENDWVNVRDEIKDRLIIPSVLTLKKESGISKLFRVMINKYTEGSVASRYSFVGDFLELLSYVDKETRTQLEGKIKASMTGVYIVKCKKYIDIHYSEKVNIADIAEICNVSKSYLCRLFKKETGKTIIEYLNEVRVNNARELLRKSPEITAEMVVNQVGFCDVRYMNIMFKRFLGVTIRDCRKIDKELSLYARKTWERLPEEKH